MQKNSIAEEKKKKSFLKKFGKWGPIMGVLWIGSHIAVPLLLLHIPAAQKYLIALENKIPFDIPGIG
tara:strand:- start:518 stop:718 length:201 start_codon:yes stop_codon:yes gene_type:complete